jgi:hypothetical protein
MVNASKNCVKGTTAQSSAGQQLAFLSKELAICCDKGAFETRFWVLKPANLPGYKHGLTSSTWRAPGRRRRSRLLPARGRRSGGRRQGPIPMQAVVVVVCVCVGGCFKSGGCPDAPRLPFVGRRVQMLFRERDLRVAPSYLLWNTGSPFGGGVHQAALQGAPPLCVALARRAGLAGGVGSYTSHQSHQGPGI